MVTLPGETRLEGWPNNLLSQASSTCHRKSSAITLIWQSPYLEVLTPIDEPLDDLSDLTASEM